VTLPKEVFDLALEQLRSIQAEITVLRNEGQETKRSSSTDIAVLQNNIIDLRDDIKGINSKIEDGRKHTTAILIALLGSATSIVTSLIAILKH
jgi:hypothetical protein